MLASTLFWAGTAYATTGCFTDTNGHWAETFICWMNDNGITSGIGPGVYGPESYVTRAQMSVFMKKLNDLSVAQAKTYTDTMHNGQILVTGGNNNWEPLLEPSTSQIYFTRYSNVLNVLRSATGAEYIGLTPDMPVALYGKSLEFDGVELCYDASTNAVLSQVGIYFVISTAGEYNNYTAQIDSTDQTDTACRYYLVDPPITLSSEHASVSLYLHINWTAANFPFKIVRTTFVFQPTGTTTLPAIRSEGKNITTLKEGTSNEAGSSSLAP